MPQMSCAIASHSPCNTSNVNEVFECTQLVYQSPWKYFLSIWIDIAVMATSLMHKSHLFNVLMESCKSVQVYMEDIYYSFNHIHYHNGRTTQNLPVSLLPWLITSLIKREIGSGCRCLLLQTYTRLTDRK